MVRHRRYLASRSWHALGRPGSVDLGEATRPRPLAESDHRGQFDCGRESLNAWFRRHDLNNHRSDASRVSVICDRTLVRRVGCITLSAGADRAHLRAQGGAT